MKKLLYITKYGLFVLLISTIICFSEETVVDDEASPDKTKSLSTIAWNIDKDEHPHTVQLKRSNKIIWSKTFTAYCMNCDWSPSSRYAFINVKHLNGIFFSYELDLLDTDNQPRLYHLHFDAIDASIGKSLNPNEEYVFGSHEDFPFGMRDEGYNLDDAAWVNSQVFKFEYHYDGINPLVFKFIYHHDEGAPMVAVAELVLKISQGSPTLTIARIYQAKNRKDLDQILNRVRIEMQKSSTPSVYSSKRG